MSQKLAQPIPCTKDRFTRNVTHLDLIKENIYFYHMFYANQLSDNSKNKQWPGTDKMFRVQKTNKMVYLII